MDASRTRDLVYSVVSICLGILFFVFGFSSLTGFWLGEFAQDTWESVPLFILSGFLLFGGSFLLVKAVNSKPQYLTDQTQDRSAWMDILKILVLIGIFIAAVWAMFHFGVQ